MDTLTDKIAAFRKDASSRMPAETLDTFSSAIQTLKESSIENNSLKTGDKAPDFILPNHNGENRSLSSYLEKGSLVLSFYRGEWCPFCNLELLAFQSSLKTINSLGANLVAVSPELPDRTMNTVEKNALQFDVLFDQGNAIAEEFGLVMTLPNTLKPIYENMGIDLLKANGDSTFNLPLPATYIINKQGNIIHHYVNADFTERLDPFEVIRVLQAN